MQSRLLVSGLPRSQPPLPPSPAPPCLPCLEGQQRAAPHSSSFPLTSAPLQTLHMNVWGPARVSGQSHERYFLLEVDDYTQYTVFPLRSKGRVVDVLIPWIRTVLLQLRERFGQDLPVMRLHSDRGGEFSSSLLRDFCRGEGILQSFMLLDSPQQNGIAERCIGLVMEVARTSMIHAAAPHFLWPFAVRYAAHQLNLWPRVSLPETSPTLRWTGEVGDASEFRVWGSRAFVRDTFADKLSPRAIPCVFLGFVPDAPGWQFYHPTSRRVLPSQDVTFDESVLFYRLFPYRSAPPPPTLLVLATGPPPVDPLPSQGPAPSGVSQVDPLPGTAPVQVTVGSGAALGAASGGAEPGAEPRRTAKLRCPTACTAPAATAVTAATTATATMASLPFLTFMLRGVQLTLTCHTSVGILLAIAAARHLPLRQIDVKNAFLYALVDAVIYVEQPHTYGEGDSCACQLQKSLYGIKQAPRLWQQYLHNILLEIGFKQPPHDLGMYRCDFHGEYIPLTVYVDDLLYTGSSKELLEHFEKNLAGRIDITCNHDVKQFIGLNISYSPEAIHLSAAKYAEELGKRFNIAPAPLSTPYRTPGPNHKPDNKALSPARLQTY
ncbi:unnamed protein product [Closterium sp. NIES-54]